MYYINMTTEKIKFTDNYLERQLLAAVYFKNIKTPGISLESIYDNVESAIDRMIDCVEHEAHESYENPVHMIHEPILHIVDISSVRPGIIKDFVEETYYVHHVDTTNMCCKDIAGRRPPFQYTDKRKCSKEKLMERCYKKQDHVMKKQQNLIEKKNYYAKEKKKNPPSMLQKKNAKNLEYTS
jgi:hypothetical protein